MPHQPNPVQQQLGMAPNSLIPGHQQQAQLPVGGNMQASSGTGSVSSDISKDRGANSTTLDPSILSQPQQQQTASSIASQPVQQQLSVSSQSPQPPSSAQQS